LSTLSLYGLSLPLASLFLALWVKSGKTKMEAIVNARQSRIAKKSRELAYYLAGAFYRRICAAFGRTTS
jgi:hypothetical protein